MNCHSGVVLIWEAFLEEGDLVWRWVWPGTGVHGTVQVALCEPGDFRHESLMAFCPPRLLGAAESARRRPEHEAPAAAGCSASLPVPSAPHRWAPWEVTVH